ncbi:MAG: shikimate kinase [Pyramidobacter sp.]|jgi:shikimate dehydrogenase
MPRFGLIGRRLGHSFSPAIHRLIGGYEYDLCEVEPEDLDEFLRQTDYDGFNVTVPYKVDALRSCAALSPRARAIGCVNTLTRGSDGTWQGDNTDWDGFLHLLGDDAQRFRGKPAVVFGSGGASKTAVAALTAAGIHCSVISRRGRDTYENLEKHADAELAVNATPVGMYPKNGFSPADLRRFPRCRLVLDVIYNPWRTALVLQAEELGIAARSGLSMLTAQAVRAAELFLRRSLRNGLADEIADEIARQTRNVVLIGMPGCGKTTTAQALGKLTGRPVADIDSLIVRRTGKTVPEIFAQEGEAAFRRLETQVLADETKKSGLIIAAGGGVVTREENRNLIRQNGLCVFLDRSGDLPTDGRPLSLRCGVEKLRAQRLPLYRAWADLTLSASSPEEAAKKIMEALKL